MTNWDEVAAVHPEFCARVRRLFDGQKHKTVATLRRDGSPRLSGTELEFSDGEIWLGMMPGSLKALDLRRDPRLAVHSPTVDPPPGNDSGWVGDAKIAGVAVEVGDPDQLAEPHRFRIDITEVVLTTLSDPPEFLVIESWHPGRGVERRERR